MVLKNFYAKNVGKLTRSCGTCDRPGRTFEIENVVVDGLKEAVVGLQINMQDRALVLKDIQVTNAKRNKGKLSASICKTYEFIGAGIEPKYSGSGQVPNVCTWGSDVSIA